MRRTIALLFVSALLTPLALMATTAPAGAHEGELIADSYNVVVRWGDEPAYNGFENSVQVILSDAAHKPITDLGDTLQVEVITGDQKVTLPFEANFEVGGFGEPGDYRAWLVPTKAGNYTFHLVGTIHGDKIDESFTSSDTTFDPVKDISEVEFPTKDPTTGQLAEKAQRTDSRLAAIDDVATKGKDDAGKATTLAIIGIVVGVLGLAAGGIGLTRKR